MRFILYFLNILPCRVSEEEREKARRSGVLVNRFSPWSSNLFLITPKWRCVVIFFWGVLSEFDLSDIVASILEGFFGVIAVSDAGLTNLEACELMSRHMIAFSGAMPDVCFREISSEERIFFVLHRGSGHDGEKDFGSLVFIF